MQPVSGKVVGVMKVIRQTPFLSINHQGIYSNTQDEKYPNNVDHFIRYMYVVSN